MAIKYLLNTPNADNTISSSEIASDAVIAAKIASNAVTTAKIDALAVTTAKIDALAVTEGKIASDAVTTAKIADGAVTEGKIGALAVTEGKIAALAVTEGKIAALAVTEGKIASDAVTANKIASNAVTTAKINALAVTTAKIDSNAVTTAKIAALAVTSAEIAANAVTGAKLASDVDLPVGTLLNGTSLLSQIAAAAGGYDFKESAVTMVTTASDNVLAYNDSGSTAVTANLPDVPAHGFLIAHATLALDTAISANQNRALVNGDRVVFSQFSGSAPQASKRTGIYTVAKGAGKGSTSAAQYYTFTRASDADSTTNFNLGALVYLNSGDFSGAGVFLGAGTFNDDAALFTLLTAGTEYTAGNGISISGGNAISVSADAAGPVTVSGSGVSVRAASASQSGVITSTQFKNLTRTVAASAESATATQTTNTTPNSFNLPVTAINTVVLVRAVVHSLSTGTLKNCVTEVRFALRRGSSGASVLIGNTVTIFKEGDASGITAMTVEGTVGEAGADYITITGVNTFTIDHNVVVTTQIIPNALSNA